MVFVGVARPGAAKPARCQIGPLGQAVVVLHIKAAGAFVHIAHTGYVRDGVNKDVNFPGQYAAALRSGLLRLHDGVHIGCAGRYLRIVQRIKIPPALRFHSRTGGHRHGVGSCLCQQKAFLGRGLFAFLPCQPQQRNQRVQCLAGAGFQKLCLSLNVCVLHGLVFDQGKRFQQQGLGVSLPKHQFLAGLLPVNPGVLGL